MEGRDAVAGSSPGWTLFAAAALALGWLALPDIGFRDSGEIGSAGALLGVAHPTGFALDLLLLRCASLLPLGNIAWRQNLLVALEAAAALGVLAHLCDALARRLRIDGALERWLGAAFALLGFGAWLTFLDSALAVEVYSLALLAVGLSGSSVAGEGRARALCWLVLGFSPGLHVTAGLSAALLCFGAWLHAGAKPNALRVRMPLVAFGALIIAYLPLASAHDPVIDWGDPETPARILQHLTAARIRGAAHAEGAFGNAPQALLVVNQWLELWPFVPLALLALAVGLRQAPLVVLVPLALLASDLGYAAWVNPMGAPDRQVGHVAGAGLALLAGVGLAWCGKRAAALGRNARTAFVLASVAGCAFVAARVPRAEIGDGYSAGELFGSGGPVARVPPRALVICWDDDACAGGLFATAVEAVRPDVDVVPGQHLWDPTVLRRIEGVPRIDARSRAMPEPERRIPRMREVTRALLEPPQPRPLLFESIEPIQRSGAAMRMLVSDVAPYLLAVPRQAPALPIDAALRSVEQMRDARFGAESPRSERARMAWSHVFSLIGQQGLGSDAAVRALRSAVLIAPERAVAWTNLSVALERRGDLAHALESAERAVALAPERATPWVNVVRLQLALGDAGAARRALELARHAGVADARLDQLGQAVGR